MIIIIWENHGLRNTTNGQLGIINNDPKIINLASIQVRV